MARTDRVGEYHKSFAERIVRQLKEGTAPWQKPWKPGERSLPKNLLTGRPYTGGNSLYLSVAALEKGYADNRWATYRQITAAGGHVRRGEKGTQILFWSTKKVAPAKDDQGNPKLTDSGEPIYTRLDRPRPYAKVYTVFNTEQTRGLPERPPATPPAEWDAHSQADAIIDASGVSLQHQAGDRAYYSLRNDQVVLPERGQFPSAAGYYHVALHELGHATGHPDRMNRSTLTQAVKSGRWGGPAYAKEELRAEISSMMTGEKIGLGHNPRHGTDYVASWIKALEDDPREIYRAAADADKISRFLIEPAKERLHERDTDTRARMESHAPHLDRPATPDRDFNRAVERAATTALSAFENNHVHPPEEQDLVRQLQSIHLAASQNTYHRTADFAPIVADLQNYATTWVSNPAERSAVLALADNFRDPERLNLRTPANPSADRGIQQNGDQVLADGQPLGRLRQHGTGPGSWSIEYDSPEAVRRAYGSVDPGDAWGDTREDVLRWLRDARDPHRNDPDNRDLNHRIQAAATAGLAALRSSPDRHPGDRRVLLSTLHDIDNQAATRDFDHNSKFSATAQRLLDYADHQDPGPRRETLTSAGHAFRQLPTPERAINHRIVDASQDALHHLDNDPSPDLVDSRDELLKDLTRVNTIALHNGYRPGDSFHDTADQLDSFAQNDQVQSAELSQAADRLRAAQHSLDRQLDHQYRLRGLDTSASPSHMTAAAWRQQDSEPNQPAFHPSISLRDRIDAHLQRQGMREKERESFLNYLDNNRTNGLRDYATRNGITSPDQIRAKERAAAPSR